MTTMLASAVLLATVFTLVTTANVGDSCQTPNSTAGTCTYLEHCPYIHGLLKMPVKPTRVEQYLRKCHCGSFDRRFKAVVCCPDPELPVVHRNLRLINREGCGFAAVDRIIGGNESRLAEFPWMALLSYRGENNFEDKCAGTLITDRFVLTAAHCITRTLSHIRLGEHDVRTDPDCQLLDGDLDCSAPVQNFTVQRTWVHPRYSMKALDNDIALIQLNRRATITEYVKSICLPVEETNLEGNTLTVAGWGVTEHNTTSPVLMYTHVPITNRVQCHEVYSNSGLRLSISDNQICAGGGGDSDSCNGDSGGPMMGFTDGSDKYTQFGIVSYGPQRCARQGIPAVYTDVRKYITWILNTIR